MPPAAGAATLAGSRRSDALTSVLPSARPEPCAPLAPAADPPQNRGRERTGPKEELQAAIEARKEVGAELEPAVLDAFVARIEQRLADRAEETERSLKRKREHQREMVLGAMAISIPLLAIAAIFTGLAGVIAVCAALAVIAIASRR